VGDGAGGQPGHTHDDSGGDGRRKNPREFHGGVPFDLLRRTCPSHTNERPAEIAEKQKIRIDVSSVLSVMRHPARLDRLSDDALLAAVALEERDAVTVFVRRFQRRVYGLAITITGDAALADDIAQLSFERAWRHAGSYDPRRAAVTTWLLTITRNVSIDAMRVRRAVPVDPMIVADLMPWSNATDPQQSAVDTDQLGRLGVELASLPPDQRRAVLLATVAGRTALEIAELEAIPLGTAKTRIRTGLRRLRAAVEEVST
jgi:RNA polymerase sigma-70 factor (ECF subfamily)